jgi:BirA family transcriptional regulator, biotin operon repressor / biotin---[acetyl-CoA-carboxylase] ligase
MTLRPDLPPAYRLIALDSVGSTNEEAKARARDGAEDGTIVWAREQTAGRGRDGRHWVSPRGNLYFSLILRPECAPAQGAQISFVAALGVGTALASVVPPLVRVQYKWPNDVLLDGAKVAGILLETESAGADALAWLIVGVGINLANHPDNTPYPATDLRTRTGDVVTPEEMLGAFGRHFLTWTNTWLEDGFAPVRAAWREWAKGIGETIRVRLPNEELTGVFADLDDDGALLLDVAGARRRRVTAGDVFFG